MSNDVAIFNQKALTLRNFLSDDKIKNQIADALPKWLTPDRFFRVVFGALIRNPKLVDCTRESILQSVMFCAQLGIEPILGRAYLIPYDNSKFIDKEWRKVLECQAQIGYQGLIDIARRSGTIADVWGACVYEADEFDLQYGMNRGLTHRPWFLSPEKRKAGDPGECIGAYVVWQLKDGTKHPDFMPMHEIVKRRAKSQSYQWAETGDPKKGGGKRNSVWHEWPEEMILKTVIKKSSKLVPAAIDFMTAAVMDDDYDTSANASHMIDFSEAAPPKATESNFDALFEDEIKDPAFAEYLKSAAKTYRLTEEQAKHEFCRQHEQIRGLFQSWKGKRSEAGANPGAGVPEEKSFRDEWIDLKQKGYGSFVQVNLEKFNSSDKETKIEAIAKWNKFYQSYPCPIVFANNTQNAHQATGEPQGEAIPVEVMDSHGVPELSELQASQAIIKKYEQEHLAYVLQSKKELGMVLSSTPQTIDGCNVLIERIKSMLAERPPK
jgi:recombination protein RecT